MGARDQTGGFVGGAGEAGIGHKYGAQAGGAITF